MVITKTKDDRCDTTIYDRNTNINLTSFDGKPAHSKKAETTIYTDGSKREDGVGSGFVLYHKNKRMHTESIHLPHTSTVFQAEIEAISHACQYAIANETDLNLKYIKILSDSQAAIKTLNNPRITSHTVLKALEYMETLALQVKSVTLAWTKAHIGTKGNEQADQAAKDGAAGGSHMNITKTLIPWQAVKTKNESNNGLHHNTTSILSSYMNLQVKTRQNIY